MNRLALGLSAVCSLVGSLVVAAEPTIVRVYSAPWCAPCHAKKAMLLEAGAKIKVETAAHGMATPYVVYRDGGREVCDYGERIESGKYRLPSNRVVLILEEPGQ